LEALLLAARQSEVQFAVVNPDSFLPSQQLIQQQIAVHLGEQGLVRMHRWEPATRTTTGSPAPLGLPGPLVRDLEAALELFAAPPKLAYALEQRANDDDDPARQFLQVHLGFATGMALIDYDNRLPRGASYRSLCVIGSTGAAYRDDHQNVQLLYRGGHAQAIRTDEGTKHLTAMIQHFADALGSGSDLSPTVTIWRSVLALVAAIKQSIATRQAVQLEH
jgi:predicted dehydrogenase